MRSAFCLCNSVNVVCVFVHLCVCVCMCVFVPLHSRSVRHSVAWDSRCGRCSVSPTRDNPLGTAATLCAPPPCSSARASATPHPSPMPRVSYLLLYPHSAGSPGDYMRQGGANLTLEASSRQFALGHQISGMSGQLVALINQRTIR